MSTRKRRRPAQGHTLLELVAATSIIAMTLVPALGMMRDSLRVGREIETNTLMATLCVNKVEEMLAKTSADWKATDLPPDDFASEGYPQLKYKVVRSDSPSDGGITDSLMVIEATVWNDVNDNDAWEKGEGRVVFATKLARVASYEYEALGL